MLVLSRAPGERIVATPGIVIEVLKISGGIVQLGFHADRGVQIDREEVFVSKGGELPARHATRGRNNHNGKE